MVSFYPHVLQGSVGERLFFLKFTPEKSLFSIQCTPEKGVFFHSNNSLQRKAGKNVVSPIKVAR